jgi:hypothetical protein
MSKERLNGLSILHMNSDVVQTVDFTTIIKEFAKNKAQKAILK